MSTLSLPSLISPTIAGLEELVGGAYNWRVWHLLGVSELRNRYTRSRFGQVWLVLSTGSMNGALAVVWSLLWNQSLPELMPFIVFLMIRRPPRSTLFPYTTPFHA